MIFVARILGGQQVGDSLGHSDSETFQNGINGPRRIQDDFSRPFFVVLVCLAGFLHRLERVTEWTMPYVVYKCGKNGDIRFVAVELGFWNDLFQHFQKRSCGMKHAN